MLRGGSILASRVRVDTRRNEKTFVFDTCDHAFNDAVLHKNLVMN